MIFVIVGHANSRKIAHLMIDISSHTSAFRQTKACAVISVSKTDLIETIKNNAVPKGDIFEISRTAGILAAKQTANVIPNCHNVPIENIEIDYEIIDLEIHCKVTVSTVYKTGVAVAAIYSASVAAVTLYDLLKSFDNALEISSVKVVQKNNLKSKFFEEIRKGLTAAILICSDAVMEGQKKNKSGEIIKQKLIECNLTVTNHEVLPNDEDIIRDKILELSPTVNILVIAGGTGVLSKDNTPETVRPLLDMEIPGISEAARNYGQDRTPYAMLSRGIAGIRGKSLILVIPGSSRGTEETMDALFPYILHIFKFQKL